MSTQQADVLRIDDDGEQGVLVQPPVRLQRFMQRVARLQPGKYVLTLTIAQERAFWTIQEMGGLEK
jgi:hypothetical protein